MRDPDGPQIILTPTVPTPHLSTHDAPLPMWWSWSNSRHILMEHQGIELINVFFVWFTDVLDTWSCCSFRQVSPDSLGDLAQPQLMCAPSPNTLHAVVWTSECKAISLSVPHPPSPPPRYILHTQTKAPSLGKTTQSLGFLKPKIMLTMPDRSA